MRRNGKTIFVRMEKKEKKCFGKKEEIFEKKMKKEKKRKEYFFRYLIEYIYIY